MTNLFDKMYCSIFLLFISGSALLAQAPASSDSPYSDQKFTPPDDPSWYETPSLWIALMLVVVVLTVLRMRKQQEKYT